VSKRTLPYSTRTAGTGRQPFDRRFNFRDFPEVDVALGVRVTLQHVQTIGLVLKQSANCE
jgi:hypothetical protein